MEIKQFGIESTAWCPSCGDMMKIIQDKLKENEQWLYRCTSCEKDFKFVECIVFVK